MVARVVNGHLPGGRWRRAMAARFAGAATLEVGTYRIDLFAPAPPRWLVSGIV